VREFKIIRDFRDRLIGACVKEGEPGCGPEDINTIGPIIDFSWDQCIDDSACVPFRAFAAALEEKYGITPTKEEKYGLLSAFDPFGQDAMSIPDFTDFLSAAVVYLMDDEGRPISGAAEGAYS
jgi:hypothetical protein